MRVAVDGPKNSESDRAKVSEVIRELEAIDWTTDVKHLIRNSNTGIRFAVPEAVSWAIQETGQVIVIEDDVRIGQDFFYFMEYALESFRDDPMIGHVSGYNAVPKLSISKPDDICRASIYPESYAWGTWANKWKCYSDEIPRLTTKELENKTGSFWSAVEWRINFHDARLNNVSTWAYRWVASLWRNNLLVVTPNRNIGDLLLHYCHVGTYAGQNNGTHTRTGPRWPELETLEIRQLQQNRRVSIDARAEKWMSRIVFRGNPMGVIVRVIESLALGTLATIAEIKKEAR